MQIFLSSPDIFNCAKNLDDLRLNKQIIEACQIASTAAWKLDCSFGETLTSQKIAYLPTHENHPLVIWTSENYNNLLSIVQFGLICSNEYYIRFHRAHKTNENFFYFWHKLLDIASFTHEIINNINLIPNCTTNHKHIKDIHKAYKQELIFKWKKDKKFPKWTNRQAPEFWDLYNKNKLI